MHIHFWLPETRLETQEMNTGFPTQMHRLWTAFLVFSTGQSSNSFCREWYMCYQLNFTILVSHGKNKISLSRVHLYRERVIQWTGAGETAKGAAGGKMTKEQNLWTRWDLKILDSSLWVLKFWLQGQRDGCQWSACHASIRIWVLIPNTVVKIRAWWHMSATLVLLGGSGERQLCKGR